MLWQFCGFAVRGQDTKHGRRQRVEQPWKAHFDVNITVLHKEGRLQTVT